MEDRDIEWFIDTAAEAVKFLDENTRVNLVPLARPDYHMEWEGAATAGGAWTICHSPGGPSGVGRGLTSADVLPFAEHDRAR
ncbi:hypothetical protein NHF46_01340 [Arthrobacter alpinus]|nr:hypothetical protein [Arthrobacter alpinus]